MLKRIAVFIRRHDGFAVGVEIMVVVIGLLLAFQLDRWLFFWPDAMEAPRSEQPEIEGILDSARRLQNRPDFIAWLPYVRQMQAERTEVHGMRLERAGNVLGLLQAYAEAIGGE